MENKLTQANPVPEYCTLRSSSECGKCSIHSSLMCRFDSKDLVHFLISFLPFAIAAVAGVIRAGYGTVLLGWAAYGIFFFVFWEARILCKYCPYWAANGRILHCHANYGVFKIWKHDPRPMNMSEKVQFVAGALIFLAYPLFFSMLGGEYVLTLVACSAAVASAMNLKKNACTRCINFSCPMNSVPKSVVDQYLLRNPILREAWKSQGYEMSG